MAACVGVRIFNRAFAGEANASVIEQIAELMPRDGDTRDDTAQIYQHVFNRVVELTAGSEAEKLQFGDNWPATDDRKQERQLAGLIFSSQEAQSVFIEACSAEARAILRRRLHLPTLGGRSPSQRHYQGALAVLCAANIANMEDSATTSTAPSTSPV